MRIVAVIPALNEAERVAMVINELRIAAPGADVLVIDDGSTDLTSRQARAVGAKVIRHPFRLGYGAALRSGYSYAYANGYDICVQVDADGQHDIAAVPRLIEAIRAGADVAIGSRFQGQRPALGAARLFGRIVVRALLSRLSGLSCTDPTSGLRALSRRSMAMFRDELPDDYPELDSLIRARYGSLNIIEVPCVHRPRRGGRSMHAGIGPVYYAYKVGLASTFSSIRARHGTQR